jgi:hypothetical protein
VTQRVLLYERHWAMPVPFICIEIEPGLGQVIWPPKQRRKQPMRIGKGDHGGRRVLEPEDWDDKLCVVIAKWALTGKC